MSRCERERRGDEQQVAQAEERTLAEVAGTGVERMERMRGPGAIRTAAGRGIESKSEPRLRGQVRPGQTLDGEEPPGIDPAANEPAALVSEGPIEPRISAATPPA